MISGTWIALPVRGMPMQRINVQYFYQLASKLIPLKEGISGEHKIFEKWAILMDAEREISSFVENPYLPPETSLQVGRDLHNSIAKITNKPFAADPADFEALVGYAEVSELLASLYRFEVVLQADFSRRDILRFRERVCIQQQVSLNLAKPWFPNLHEDR